MFFFGGQGTTTRNASRKLLLIKPKMVYIIILYLYIYRERERERESESIEYSGQITLIPAPELSIWRYLGWDSLAFHHHLG